MSKALRLVWEILVGLAIFNLAVRVSKVEDKIVAIGPDTQKALDELTQVIANEVSEFAEYAISLTNADAETAAAIRARVGDVAGIVTKAGQGDQVEVPNTPEPVTPPAE